MEKCSLPDEMDVGEFSVWIFIVVGPTKMGCTVSHMGFLAEALDKLIRQYNSPFVPVPRSCNTGDYGYAR